jgi:hypothetical protein
MSKQCFIGEISSNKDSESHDRSKAMNKLKGKNLKMSKQCDILELF